MNFIGYVNSLKTFKSATHYGDMLFLYTLIINIVNQNYHILTLELGVD